MSHLGLAAELERQEQTAQTRKQGYGLLAEVPDSRHSQPSASTQKVESYGLGSDISSAHDMNRGGQGAFGIGAETGNVSYAAPTRIPAGVGADDTRLQQFGILSETGDTQRGQGVREGQGRDQQGYGLSQEVKDGSGMQLAGQQTTSRVAPLQVDYQTDVMTRKAPPSLTQDDAATLIQSSFRGYLLRKQMIQRGQPVFLRSRVQQHQQQRHQQRANGQNIKLPAVPVIDINKLPRYGVLAPPIERPEPQAGKMVDLDLDLDIFVKNRGVLQEALVNKTGYLEDAPMRMWSQYAVRQKQRYVPIPPDANRRTLPETKGYRLRVLRVNDLPLHTTFDGRTFEFQLGVSLYDEAYGTFYGNTVYSTSDAYDRNRAAQRNAIDLDFSFDVYYHSKVSDPRCMAVVEIIMLERMLDGVVKGEYSLGWALLPLFKVAGPTPGLPAGVALDPQVGKPLSVPIISGTPRYLLFRNVYNEDLRPPKVIPNCSILFQAESYPAMDAYIPLLPEDFLVTYSDVIPGLRRFDTAGQLSITTKTAISTLASPMLCPTYSVVLRRLQLALPSKLHELLQTMDPKRPQAFVPPNHMPGMQQHEEQTLSMSYTLRVSVHNGRTFVGPSYDLTNISQLDVPGWKVLQVPAPDAVFDYVMGDVLTTIVVELLVTPEQVFLPASLPPVQYLLGWSAFVPFAFISDDGSQAEVAVGVHRYVLGGRQAGLLLRDQPLLDWRALLGDSMMQDVPDPMVEFQLFETGRTPIPPPLHSKFLVIEHQREEEAALGEQPLEQVLAPVPVPYEIAQDMPPPAIIKSEEPLIPDDRLGQRDQQIVLPPIIQQQQDAMNQALYGHPMPSNTSAERDELRDLALAMQRQLNLLTRAVDELKDERKSLRNSVIALVDGGAGSQPFAARSQAVNQSSQARPAPDEIRRLMDLPATVDLGDLSAFSGGPPPGPGTLGTVPSRMLMQQLYDAGMLDALPEDVQALLRRRGPPRGPSAAPIDLTLEARDPRMASDVVFQFLAYRHHDTLNAPVNVQSLYFTFQFYHFAPTTTVMSYLVQPNPALQQQLHEEEARERGVPPPDPTTVNATRLLVTNHPHRKGAGVTVKYVIDSTLDAVPSGQTAQQAAYEGNMHFSQYLAAKTLSVDVWDGESLLQIGTATLNMQQLLRQGRDFAELLIEVPIMENQTGGAGGAGTAAGLLGQSVLSGKQGGTAEGAGSTPTILSKGSIVLRIINIGREPRHPDAAGGRPLQPDTNAGKKVRVRARPAWAIKGPISKELANGEREPLSNPAASQYQGEQFLVDLDEQDRAAKRQAQFDPRQGLGSPLRDPGGAPAFGSPGASGIGGDLYRAREASHPRGGHGGVISGLLAEDERMHILERTHHKSNRLHNVEEVLQELIDDDVPKVPISSQTRDEQYRQVQKQLLTDVSSVRARQKHALIKEQLRRNLVISRVIRPGYGEVVVYEHEFANPFAQEMVFEVHINRPEEVSVLTRMDEYKALRAANARFFGNPSQPVGYLEQEIMAGNRIYLKAHERITLPFKLQSFEPPHGYTGPKDGILAAPSDGSLPAELRKSALGKAAGGSNSSEVLNTSGSDKGHVVTIELMSVSHDHPVMLLELQVVPRPLIIDRTLRFYHPEHSLMRQTVHMKELPGTDTTFAGGALRNLAVACSHPDIITGAGSSGLVGGAERDEVYIKYKCGGAPHVTHFYVLLYLDRLMARPVEIWQVFAHCLRKVDMRAVIGQTSQASVVVRGAQATRRVACYTSHPDELQVSPGSFVLVAGALTELLLSFRPVTQGIRDIKVHLVDTETRELVYALLVSAEAQGPLITRTFEIELPAGSVANKKIQYTNPYQSYRTFTLRSNQPWLVHFTPQRLQLPAGATRPLGMTFDGRAATTGILDVLVFVNDEEDKTEECFKVRVRIYR